MAVQIPSAYDAPVLASWLVVTHFRPLLLRAAIASLKDAVIPPGWETEIIVVYSVGDLGAERVCAEEKVRGIRSESMNHGPKRNQALRAARGEFVLVADDDDMQSPQRLVEAVTAHELGHAISETRTFRYLHYPCGKVVTWNGSGTPQKPPVIVGTARNYRRSVLERVFGWRDLPRLVEKDIQGRITKRLGRAGKARDLAAALATSTICVQHDKNIWQRPLPEKGETIEHGAYTLIGEGYWDELADFPRVVAKRLGLVAE